MDKNGNGNIIDLDRLSAMPAKVLQDAMSDPAHGILGAPPNLGRMVPPHIYTVQGRVGTIARVYRNADEAMRDSVDNARYMRNECGIMECLEARQRGTALLKWHLAPEDEKSQKQKDLVEELTKQIEAIPNFVELRRNLLEALWFGKYGVAYQWSNKMIAGRMRKSITHWEPRHGDKLVFRYDDGEAKYDPRQVGIRVGAGYRLDINAKGVGYWSTDGQTKVEPTDQGLAYFFDKWERDNLLAIHKHIIEDGPWEDPLAAGSIHGVGIRSRIYASWFSMQELLGYLMEYVERAAAGVEIWPYEYGNDTSEQKTRQAAEEHMVGGRSIILMPVYRGEQADMFRVEHIEPGLGGVEALKALIIEYFGHKIKRYILGQTLTSEAEATGLGSGVADAHMATYSDIIRYDARKLEQTLTTDLVDPIKNQNIPKARGVNIRFVIDTESDEMQEKLEAYERAWNMGLKLKAEDVASMIGASTPSEDDETLENPQIQQAAAMGAMGGVGFAGPEGGAQPPGGPGGPPEGGPGEGPEPAKPLAPEPVQPPQDEEPEPYIKSDKFQERYSQWDESKHPRDPAGKFVEIHDPATGEIFMRGEHAELSQALKEAEELGDLGLEMREATDLELGIPHNKPIKKPQEPQAPKQKPLPPQSDTSDWRTGSPIKATVYRGKSRGGGGLMAQGAGKYWGLEPGVAELFSEPGTIEAASVSLKNPVVVRNDAELKSVKQAAEAATGLDFGKAGNLYEGWLLPKQAQPFTDYLVSQGHDGIVVDFKEAAGGRQLVEFSPKEDYEAEKERVITSMSGGPDPFVYVEESHKVPRYALGYQDKPNGVFACFNCRWRDRSCGDCSLYQHLNEKYERFDLDAGVDADAWCELHTEPTSGNLVRIEKYALAAKWDESKHPRDASGKFGSGGGGGRPALSHGQMTAEAQGLLAEVSDMRISKRDHAKLANLRGTLRRNDLTPEELRRVIFDLKTIKRAYEDFGERKSMEQHTREGAGTDTGYRKPPEASEEAKARAKAFAEEWAASQKKKKQADARVAKEVGKFEGWQKVAKQPKSKQGQLALFMRQAYADLDNETAGWAEHYAKQMGLFKEEDHPRDDEGKFTSGGGKPAATQADEPFELKNKPAWVKPEFQQKKKKQQQMWTGLDLMPGQKDFLEENPELAAETHPEAEEKGKTSFEVKRDWLKRTARKAGYLVTEADEDRIVAETDDRRLKLIRFAGGKYSVELSGLEQYTPQGHNALSIEVGTIRKETEPRLLEWDDGKRTMTGAEAMRLMTEYMQHNPRAAAKESPRPEPPAELSGQKRLFEPEEASGQKLMFKRSGEWMKYRQAWEESKHPRDEAGRFGSGARTVKPGGKQKTWTPGEPAKKSSDRGEWSKGGERWVQHEPDTGLTGEPFGKYEPPTLGVPRKHMPQIAGKDKPEFFDQLNSKGIHYNEATFAVQNLRGTQSDYNPEKVAAMAERMRETGVQPGSPVLASKDGFILDGHHRWRAQREVDPKSPMHVIQVDLPIRDLLKEAASFPNVFYVGTEEGAGARKYAAVCGVIDGCVDRYRQTFQDFREEEHPRDASGKFASKPEGSKPAQRKPAYKYPTATLKGPGGSVEVEWKQEKGGTFWRRAGREDLGWTYASEGAKQQIEEQKPKSGAEKPQEASSKEKPKQEDKAKEEPKRPTERKAGPEIVSFKDLSAAPERFQYKIQDIDPETGVTREFSDVEFDPMLAGMLYVWQDPEDGKTYVINGHHRYEIGKRSGYSGDMPVFYIDADSDEEARAKGALINIAEGHGTALDACKYMRDMGLTGAEGIAHLKENNVSLKGKVASEALKLSNLSDNAYRELAYGRLNQDHASAIGEVLAIPEGANEDRKHAIWDAQNKVVSAIQKRTGYVPTKVAREMAVVASLAPSVNKQASLFGDEGAEELLLEERGEVQAAVRESLLKEIRGLGAVSAKGRAELIAEKGVGQVSGEKAAEEKRRVQTLQDVFDREIRYRGDVGGQLNRVLNDAAKEYRNARNKQQRGQIKRDAAEESRAILEASQAAERQGKELVAGSIGGSEAEQGFSQPASSPGQVAMFQRDLEEIRERYRRNWELEKFKVAYRAAAEPERYREAQETSGPPKQRSTPQEWSSFQGERGGRGWRNVRTGEVLYQEERPGTEPGQESPQGQRPAPQDQPPQEQQLPVRGTFKADPKELAKADKVLQTIPQTGEEWAAWEEALDNHPYRKEAVRRLEAYSVVSKFHTDKEGNPQQGSVFWSENKYRREDGTYEPERAALHRDIVKRVLNPKARAKPGEQPKAFILTGPPAAGKTSAGQPMATKVGLRLPHGDDPGNVTIINPDDIKEMLPEYEGWNAGIVHEESAWLSENEITDTALEERHNSVFDLTGKNAQKMEEIVDRLDNLGYHITVCNVQTQSTRTGWRAWRRFTQNAFGNNDPDAEPGRYVPPEYAAKDVNGKPEETYRRLKGHPAVKQYSMINTDGFEDGQGPRLVEEGSKG